MRRRRKSYNLMTLNLIRFEAASLQPQASVATMMVRSKLAKAKSPGVALLRTRMLLKKMEVLRLKVESKDLLSI